MVRRKLLEALTEQDQHLLQQQAGQKLNIFLLETQPETWQVSLRKKLLWCLRHAKAAGGVAVTMAAIDTRPTRDGVTMAGVGS